MERIAFADESGTHGNPNCYSIGVVSLDAAYREEFERYFRSKLLTHGVQGEAKWTKVRESHGLINFALVALYSILHSRTACFDVMVVNTSVFRNWNSLRMTREDAFYQTYTYLLRHIAKRANRPSEIYVDDCDDSYAKRDEMIEHIGNNMLAQLAGKGRLTGVHKADSRAYVGIQVADVLTGAVNAAHARRFDPEFTPHLGKQLAIERLAKMVGWNDLCYDTFPSNKFNVWHFPTEYRARPRTQQVNIQTIIPYILPVDLILGTNLPRKIL